MQDYLYTVPNEVMQFVEFEFDRFRAPKPSRRALDKVIDFTLAAVVKKRHFPTTPYDAVTRYREARGLMEIEKEQILGKLEYELRIFLKIGEQEITFNQMHLATWATIMFAWSQGGEKIVDWYKKTVAKEEIYAQTPIQNRHQRFG